MKNENDKTFVYIAGFALVVFLLFIGYKVIGVTVGPVRVDLEPPSNQSQSYNQPEQLPTSVSVPTAVQFPYSIDGVWDGQYYCLGGIRNVQLTITDSTSSLMKATFYYYASAETPDTIPGSFNLVGFYDRNTGVVQLETSSPEEPNITGINGVLSRTGVIFEGDITYNWNTSCSWIKVSKTQ